MKAKGTAFETQVVDYLKGKGFKNVYRPATSGGLDTGDINGIKADTAELRSYRSKRLDSPTYSELGEHHRQAIIQNKNCKTFSLSSWLNDAVSQAKQEKVGGDALPIVVFKRPGVGTKNLGDTYALLRLEDLADLLKDAGYV